MEIEILYVERCPSHPAAVKLVKEVLAVEGITAEIHEILVHDKHMAGKLKFPGSPTIRINGQDVAPLGAEIFTMSCRLYPGSSQTGVPSAELVRRAIMKART